MNGPVFDSSIPSSAVRLMSRFPRALTPAHWSTPRRPRLGLSEIFGRVMQCILLTFVALFTAGFLSVTLDPWITDAFGGLIGLVSIPLGIMLGIRFSRPRDWERRKATKLGRRYHGAYFLPEDLDQPAQQLFDRAERAARSVLESEINRRGVLDDIANQVILPRQVWAIAQTLYTQTRLRSEQDEARLKKMTPELEAVLTPQVQALEQSIAAVARRVEALETYADRVATAESVFTAEKLMASNHKYEDLLTLTHDEASVPILTEQAASSSAALSVSLQAALDAGRSLG
jgi:hypothetical protein